MFYQDGEPVRSGRLLAVEFVNDGKPHQAVWYQPAGQAGSYYAFDGQSLRRAFLRTPIEFSRISSGFGGRMHPILNTWKQHTGVDYASPIGTPIRATGDGVVAFAGQQNGYGNVVIIKHQGVYSTLYGHMSAFAKGMRTGARITQGEVIGFVGMTGWATGPHLHYEFRINNQAKDPLRVAMPQALPIPGEQLAAFRTRSADLNHQIMLLRSVDGGA
jgi:murein DD-endopeptidase MepM/ murein hydrolase activator NlpD